MKSEPDSKAIKLSHESEDDSCDVDDPGSSGNELKIVTSTEEEKEKEEEIKILNNDNVNICKEGENFRSHKTGHLNNDANFFFEELTPDDEIFTFQCPKNFNVNSLLNQVLDLNKVTKVKDAGNKFKCQILANDKKTLTCIFPSREKNAALVKIPVAGHILIKQSIKLPKKNIKIEEICNNDKIKIKDSVIRHPLLGKNWNEHLRAVRKQIKKQKKLLKKSMEQKKSLVKAEKERKEQKKLLKAQLSLLKKSLSTEVIQNKGLK